MSESLATTTAAAPITLPGGVAPLWKIPDVAAYLGRSPRWIWRALTVPPDEPGSIPHIRVGDSPRFDAETVKGWAVSGCPPAATYAEWVAEENKRRKRA